ncbi:MAG: phosphoribosylaminoimidazolesuccinocarboxamide synthase [Gemmatimonadaceae bacterium]
MTAMAISELPLELVARGKVRDVYDAGAGRLLLVATDRVSAFDVVMSEVVPYKGAVLTQLSAWWCRQLADLGPHHVIASEADKIAEAVPELERHRGDLAGRAMLCQRTEVYPVECVIRGYLSGSAWKEYRDRGTLAGEPLPPGLRESERLDPPLFSPATKAASGHDENITVARLAGMIGVVATAELEQRSRAIYERARELAASRGIIVADTKFEFGRTPDGRTLLIDEVLTPDSSRFWPAARYAPGGPQPSFDKQPLRDYLDAERRAGRWNGEAPPPSLPPEVIDETSLRYLDAYRRITGEELPLTLTQAGTP